MKTDYIHAAVEPCKSRVHSITRFKDRDDWIKLLIAADGDELSPGAKIVGARIALHHNIETGQCNPSLAQLADGTGTSDRNVRRMLRELEQTGWLGTDQSRGRHAHSFDLRVPNSTLNPDNSVRDDVSNPDECVRVHESSTRTTVSGIPGQNGYANPDTVVRQKRESNSEKKSEGEKDSPPDLDLEDSGRRTEAEFEEFYRQYPKRVARATALKAYRAVITKKLATPAELLAGAMRYAAERSNQDPKYTKHASTWLAGGCWADEPSPIGTTYRQSESPHIARAARIARQLQAEQGGDNV